MSAKRVVRNFQPKWPYQHQSWQFALFTWPTYCGWVAQRSTSKFTFSPFKGGLQSHLKPGRRRYSNKSSVSGHICTRKEKHNPVNVTGTIWLAFTRYKTSMLERLRFQWCRGQHTLVVSRRWRHLGWFQVEPLPLSLLITDRIQCCLFFF